MGEIVPLSAGQLPAHIARRAAAAKAQNTDLSTGVSAGFPVLSYRGKVWRLTRSGVATVLVNQETGEPRQSLELVLVKANPILSKLYYQKGYVEGSNEPPDCYSMNGKAPEPDSPKKQNVSCLTCPHNQWGSRVSETSSKGKACADVRRMAVATAANPAGLMLLRVPAASLKELKLYSDVLNQRDIPYNAVLTRVGFDPEKAHPQFQFKALGLLDEATCDALDAAAEEEICAQILGTTAPVGGEYDGAPGTPVVEAPAPEPVKLTREQEMVADLDFAPPAGKANVTKATKAKATVVTVAEVAEVVQPKRDNPLVGDEFSTLMREAREAPDEDAMGDAGTGGVSASSAQVLDQIEGDPQLAAILAGLDD